MSQVLGCTGPVRSASSGMHLGQRLEGVARVPRGGMSFSTYSSVRVRSPPPASCSSTVTLSCSPSGGSGISPVFSPEAYAQSCGSKSWETTA